MRTRLGPAAQSVPDWLNSKSMRVVPARIRHPAPRQVQETRMSAGARLLVDMEREQIALVVGDAASHLIGTLRVLLDTALVRVVVRSRGRHRSLAARARSGGRGLPSRLRRWCVVELEVGVVVDLEVAPASVASPCDASTVPRAMLPPIKPTAARMWARRARRRCLDAVIGTPLSRTGDRIGRHCHCGRSHVDESA